MIKLYLAATIFFLFTINQLWAQNVGIGTSTPATKLEIQGDSGTDLLDIKDQDDNSRMYIQNQGNVGIGTSAPRGRLHVQGDLVLSSSSGNIRKFGSSISSTQSGLIKMGELTLGSNSNNLLITGKVYGQSGGSSGESEFSIMIRSHTLPSKQVRFWQTQTTAGRLIDLKVYEDLNTGRLVVGFEPNAELQSFGWDITIYERGNYNYWENENTYVELDPTGLTEINAGTNHFIFNPGGNVGIGTISPTANFHVNGSVRFSNLTTSTQSNALMIDNNGNVTTRFMNLNNWDESFSWGNHANAGYLTSFDEIDPTWSGVANTTSTIGRTGSVGIGTLIPNRKLTVNAGGDSWTARFENTHGHIELGPANAGGAHIYTDLPQFFFNKDITLVGNPSRIIAHQNNPFHIRTGSVDRFTILSNGNVGINTAAPSQRLDIEGQVRIRGGNPRLGAVLTATHTNGTATWGDPAESRIVYNGNVQAGNWYRIAVNSGGGKRASAEFTLRDNISGGGHSTLMFTAGISYNDAGNMAFTMNHHNWYNVPTFTRVRVLQSSTYEIQYLEVFVARGGNVSFSLDNNISADPWIPVEWTAGSIPAGYTSREFQVDKIMVVGDFTERLVVNKGGNVGIGTATPGQKLTIAGIGTVLGVDNTAVFSARNPSGAYESFLWPRWSDNVMYLNYGSNGFNIRNNNNATTMFMTNNNRVGIGTNSPLEQLHTTGNIRADGIVMWGTGTSRTETRTNAGLQGNAGARSGFFEVNGPSPATNWPIGASSWWHLLDVRHSNNTNNYAMQFAGSFFDQRLFYRKTNNNAAQPWSEIHSTGTLQKYYATYNFSSLGNGSTIQFIANIPGLLQSSSVSVSIIGLVPAVDPWLTIRNVVTENGTLYIHVLNNTGGTLTGTIPFAITVLY